MIRRLILAGALFCALAGSAHAYLLIGPAGGGGGGAPTVAQEVDSGFVGSGCSSPCSQTITATTSGQIIVVGFANFSNDFGSAPIITTNNGDTCTERASSGNFDAPGNTFVSWSVCPSVTVGSTSVTLTCCTGDGLGWNVFVVNGAKTTGTPYEGGTGNTSASDTVSCPITTASTDDLLFLISQGQGSYSSISTPSGWSFGTATYLWTQTSTTATTYPATLTAAGATQLACAALGILHP